MWGETAAKGLLGLVRNQGIRGHGRERERTHLRKKAVECPQVCGEGDNVPLLLLAVTMLLRLLLLAVVVVEEDGPVTIAAAAARKRSERSREALKWGASSPPRRPLDHYSWRNFDEEDQAWLSSWAAVVVPPPCLTFFKTTTACRRCPKSALLELSYPHLHKPLVFLSHPTTNPNLLSSLPLPCFLSVPCRAQLRTFTAAKSPRLELQTSLLHTTQEQQQQALLKRAKELASKERSF